jgi:hypothetical protein
MEGGMTAFADKVLLICEDFSYIFATIFSSLVPG